MFLEGLVIVSLCLAIFMVILILMHQSYQNQIKTLMKLMETQAKHFQVEKMDLLNRASSKDWQTYIQVTQGLTESSSSSDEPFKGMSDIEELRRVGVPVDDIRGYGEVLAEIPSEESMLNDMRELGLIPDDVNG